VHIGKASNSLLRRALVDIVVDGGASKRRALAFANLEAILEVLHSFARVLDNPAWRNAELALVITAIVMLPTLVAPPLSLRQHPFRRAPKAVCPERKISNLRAL
jgi:hypothetical protein